MEIKVGDQVIFAPHHIAHGQRGVVEEILRGSGAITYYRIRPLRAVATMREPWFQLIDEDFYRVDPPCGKHGE